MLGTAFSFSGEEVSITAMGDGQIMNKTDHHFHKGGEFENAGIRSRLASMASPLQAKGDPRNVSQNSRYMATEETTVAETNRFK